MNHYPHHIGDYAEATAHLSMVEDGAYSRMIRKYYATEKPLPVDVKDVQRLIGARTKEEKNATVSVLQEFFFLKEDGWHNERCDEELKIYLEGEPERVIKKTNERIRLQRHREERSMLFDQLHSVGVHADWNAKMPELRQLVQRHCNCGRPSPETNLPPLPETAPATPATANQEPIANSHSKPKTLSDPNGSEVRDVVADPSVPDCPHDKIVALYHEILPNNPRVIEWNAARKAYLRCRWREKSKKNGTTQGYTSTEQGLDWWRQFLNWAKQSDFLTGKTDGRDGKPPFLADLEWLIRPQNFVKVIEGKYHR